MKTVRQDAWTAEDDKVLAEIILRHIRTGSTQLTAFEEAGQSLGRTKAACGYRWNAIVRKEFAAQIEIAKAERRACPSLEERAEQALSGGQEAGSAEENGSREGVTWGEVLKFLRLQKSESQVLHGRLRQLERDLETQASEAERLQAENDALRADLERMTNELSIVKEDYVALVQIMERARKMTLLGEEDDDEQRPVFKMDENGNLERME